MLIIYIYKAKPSAVTHWAFGVFSCFFIDRKTPSSQHKCQRAVLLRGSSGQEADHPVYRGEQRSPFLRSIALIPTVELEFGSLQDTVTFTDLPSGNTKTIRARDDKCLLGAAALMPPPQPLLLIYTDTDTPHSFRCYLLRLITASLIEG